MEVLLIALSDRLARRLRIHARETNRRPSDVVASLIGSGVTPRDGEDGGGHVAKKKLNKQAVKKAHAIARKIAKKAGRAPQAKDYATGMKVEKDRLRKRKR